MVAERTAARYAMRAPDADPELAVKYEPVGATEGNVAGIMHWLDKSAAAGTG
jgi:hypothetical protein